jgi:hypothetical protein
MKKLSTLVMALFLVAVCFCHAQAVEVLISPDTVVIDEENLEQTITLTVHAEISCSVDPSTVVLEGLSSGTLINPATGCDTRGELVAKFSVVAKDLLLDEGTVTLTLIVGGESIGSSEISIVTQGDGPDGNEQNREGNREGAEN